MITVPQKTLLAELINTRLFKNRIDTDKDMKYIEISPVSYIQTVNTTVKDFNKYDYNFTSYNLLELEREIPKLNLYIRKVKNNKSSLFVNSIQYPFTDKMKVEMKIDKYLTIDNGFKDIYNKSKNISCVDKNELDWLTNTMDNIIEDIYNKYYHPIYGYDIIYIILDIFEIEFNLLYKNFIYEYNGNTISNIKMEFTKDEIRDINLRISYLFNDESMLFIL